MNFETNIHLLQFDIQYKGSDTIYTLPYIPPIYIDRIVNIRTLLAHYDKTYELTIDDQSYITKEFVTQNGDQLILFENKTSFGKNIDKLIFSNPNGHDYIHAIGYINIIRKSIKKMGKPDYMHDISDIYTRRKILIKERTDFIQHIRGIIRQMDKVVI